MDSNIIGIKKEDNNKDFIAVCVVYLIVLALLLGLQLAAGYGWLNWFTNLSDGGVDIVFTLLSQIVVMFLVPVIGISIYYAYKKRKQRTGMTFAEFAANGEQVYKNNALKNFGFGKPGGKVIGFAVILGLLLFFLNNIVANFSQNILVLLGFRLMSSPGDTGLTGVSGVLFSVCLFAVLPGLCEETAHRGLLLHVFKNKFGIMKAILFSSILFGLMHMSITQFFYTAIMGYFMAMSVIAMRSIWTGVIIHFMNNAIGTYMGFASDNGWVFGDFYQQFGNFIGQFGGIITLVLIVIVTYVLIIRIIHMFAKENFIKDHLHDEGGAKIPRFKGMPAVKYYFGEPLGTRKKKIDLGAAEKALFYGIFFFGTVITVMTLYWGFL